MQGLGSMVLEKNAESSTNKQKNILTQQLNP